MRAQNHLLKVIVGLGKTGLSCARFLTAKGFPIAITDSRDIPPCLEEALSEFPGIKISLGSYDEELINSASELIVSPGVSLKEPIITKKQQEGVLVSGDIELFSRYVEAKVVGITGSNGKSTVTSLLGHLAQEAGIKVAVGGNLGTPALDLLQEDHELYVVELSSFQLERTYSLHTQAAVNLNISADHMDRYSSLEEYKSAKLRIYQNCENPVINLDDPQSYKDFSFTKPTLGFRMQPPNQNEFGIQGTGATQFLALGDQKLLPLAKVPLKGRHQMANVLAALALGKAIGLPMDQMLRALQTFKGLPHRCQWVATIDGVDWYNDSKATNVGATEAAILGIGCEIRGKIILLAGGQGKNADFTGLWSPIQRFVRTVILYGEDKEILGKDLQNAAPLHYAENFKDALELAKKSAKPEDVVLLSPACASFDMFHNFEHRGEVFMELVKGLQK